MNRHWIKVAYVFLALFLALLAESGRAAEKAEEGAALDELSAEVLNNLTERNIGMGTVLESFRKGSCKVDVKLVAGATVSTATLSYSWEDADDDGVLTDAEVEIETEYASSRAMRVFVKDSYRMLRALATVTTRSLAAAVQSAETQKVTGGYQMTLKYGEEEGTSFQLTISDDFRITRFRIKDADGYQVTTTYNHEKVKDKWLVKSAVVSSSEPAGGGSKRENWSIAYQWQNGVPLLSRITMAITVGSVAGNVQMREEISARGWKLVKREQPLEPPIIAAAKREETPEVTTAGGDATKGLGEGFKLDRNTETMKVGMDVYTRLASSYYNLLTHSDVVAFEATYALEQNGQPIGTMNVSWDTRRELKELARPPFPYHVSRTQVTFDPSGAGAAGLEGKPADEMKEQVELFGKTIFSIVAERTFPFAGMVYGRKEPLGVFIDVTKFYDMLNPFIRLSTTFVTEDLCLVSNITDMTNGETRRTKFVGEVRDDKHYMSKVTFSIQPKGSGAISQSQEYTFTYFRREGVVFLRRALLEITEGKQQASLKAEFQNVTFERRKEEPEKEPQKPETPEEKEPAGTETGLGTEPAQETTEPQNDTLGTDEAVKLTQQVKVPHTKEAAKLANEVIDSVEKSYYSLLYSTDVPGLEANFSFSATGDAIGDGTVLARWNRRDPRRIGTATKVNEETGIVDMRKFVRVLLDDTLRSLVLGPLRRVHGPGVYAAKSGNHFLLDACE